MDTRPIIGITPNYDGGDVEPLLPGKPLLFVHPDYLTAVTAAGALPLILPLCPREPGPLLDRVDALLISGNEKPLPAAMRTGSEWPSLREQNPTRYASDVGWLKAALSRGMPVLGICRGMQVLNEVMGGSVENRAGTTEPICGHHQSAPGHLPSHPLHVEPGSLLARLLGPGPVAVNSFHAQGISRVGNGLRVTGSAPDDVVEAVEAISGPFCLGLQFHPEKLIGTDARFLSIFKALAAAARAYRVGLARHPAGFRRAVGYRAYRR